MLNDVLYTLQLMYNVFSGKFFARFDQGILLKLLWTETFKMFQFCTATIGAHCDQEHKGPILISG